jgi:hypothetical protein
MRVFPGLGWRVAAIALLVVAAAGPVCRCCRGRYRLRAERHVRGRLGCRRNEPVIDGDLLLLGRCRVSHGDQALDGGPGAALAAAPSALAGPAGTASTAAVA